jgi:hypothetical protein
MRNVGAGHGVGGDDQVVDAELPGALQERVGVDVTDDDEPDVRDCLPHPG